MAWFMSYHVQSWRGTWSGSGGTEWVKPDLYVDMARSLERAGFDFMMLEDGAFVPDSFGGSMDYFLRNARMVPKHDPLTLVGPLAAATDRLGLIATITTAYYPPYLAARLLTSLDHITDGRIGANLVTSHNVRTANNFGLTEQVEHDTRYAMADEWARLVDALWGSWDRDAVVRDEDRGVYVDPSKVRSVDFQGEFYSSRGPLNTMPGPQYKPVICQAGGSPAGRRFAAQHAEVILAQAPDVEHMREYREEITKLATEFGRDPADIKVMFIADFVLADTDARAADKVAAIDGDVAANIENNLLAMSYATGRDFAAYDLDAPLPSSSTNAARATSALLLDGHAPGATLREVASRPPQGLRFAGTPDSVAGQMDEAVQESGADGFLVQGTINRKVVAEIADGLAPALRRRGLIRDGYEFGTLRENLRAF